MLYKLFRLIPVFLLVLLTAQVKAATGKAHKAAGTRQEKQFNRGVDHNAFAIETATQSSAVTSSVYKLQLTQPGDIFLAHAPLNDVGSVALLAGTPRNKAITPVYLQLLFPFHGFW